MRGVGLIELMVAITIGLVLIAGALSVFVNSRQTYKVNQEVARMMENGNYGLDEIGRSLKLAGYWGRNNAETLVRRRFAAPEGNGINIAAPATNDCTAGWYANVAVRVEGLNNTNVPYNNTCIPTARYQPNSDVLVIRHVEPSSVDTADLANNTVYIRSDPTGAELFVGNAEPGGFTAIAANFRLRAMALYVSPFTVSANEVPLIPSLRKVELGAGTAGPELSVPAAPDTSEVLISGIENMQIHYGIDTNGDGSANQYIDADNVAANQWNNVSAVRIWLLVRAEAEENGYSDESTHRLPDGVTVATNDRFRRLLISRTIQLRN
jgi:type IV pilus assembly protein PilW